MGRRYEYGYGVELSLEKAIDYYKKGREMGDPRCKMCVLLHGLGHPACDLETIPKSHNIATHFEFILNAIS